MRSHQVGDERRVGDVAEDAEGAASALAHLVDHRLDLGRPPRRHHHVGAGLGEAERDPTPDPAARTGDDSDATVEPEAVEQCVHDAA